MGLNLDQVKTELGAYIKANPNILSAFVYAQEVKINKYVKTLTKINGEYPSIHAIMGRVVQGFKSEWEELGNANFRAKLLKAYKQKVNFGFKPSDVMGTWLAENYVEGKSLEEQPISKFIMEELKKAIIRDINTLSMTGVRDDANASGQFGKSLDGVKTLLTKGLANTDDPMFSIPLEALTAANVVDQIKAFELGLPTEFSDLKVFVSRSVGMLYRDAYTAEYGGNNDYTSGSSTKTPLLGLEIVMLDIPGNVIFATPEENFLRLIDIIDKPEITDIQKADYKLKLFFEFTLAYEFAINALVFVGNFDGAAVRGLGNEELNTLYFPDEVFEPVTP